MNDLTQEFRDLAALDAMRVLLEGGLKTGTADAKEIAEAAFEMADAMVEARKK